MIRLEGADRLRTRAIVTLLHSNEPSGFKAIHRIIREGVVPTTDVVVIVASVDAAQTSPLLSHRHLQSEEDLNRCFTPPFDTPQRQLAASILQYLQTLEPEVVIDTHNTSSHSEPFCVAANHKPETRLWSTLFCPRLVVLTATLGTLLEQTVAQAPVITVEFGSWMDPRVDDIAFETMKRFMNVDDPASVPADPQQQVLLHQPRRLLLSDEAHLSYGTGMTAHNDAEHLTLINSIDQCNFKRLSVGTTLGWCSSNHLPVKLDHTDDSITNYLTVSGNTVTTVARVMLFIATTDATIAAEDCIAYLVPERNIQTV